MVFRDECNRWYAAALKRGFRHVFCLIDDGRYWVLVDGLMGVPIVTAAAPSDYDAAGWYREQGFAVIEMERGSEPPLGPFIAANCVGMVKVALGIRAPFAFTPYQLYRSMRKRHGISQGNHAAGSVAAVPGR